MIVRKAKIKEAKIIGKLWNEFIKEHDAMVIKKNKKAITHVTKRKGSQKQFEKYIKSRIRSRNSMVYIAEEDGNIVAYSLILIKKNIPVFEIKELGHFADVYVKKKFMGKGISKEFRDLAINWFRKKGIKYSSIMVYPENEYAHSIYKTWGFFGFHVEMRAKL